jgi:hypothetical protein
MVRRNNNTGIRIEDDHLITEREPASPRRGRQTAVELYGVLQAGNQDPRPAGAVPGARRVTAARGGPDQISPATPLDRDR